MAWACFRVILVFFALNLNVHLHNNAVSCWTWTSDDTQLVADERYKLGKEKLNELRQLTTMPKYSQCWTQALDNLENGCQHLSDDTQHRMALQFANCFLLKTGRATYPCKKTDEISKCTEKMPSEAYVTYSQFFTHTQNMCFFLQAQVWQEETGHTIDRLSNTSATVTQQLQKASELQGEMLKDQNRSLDNQGILLKRGLELKKTLEESSIDVHRMLDDFKNSTKEQKILLFEVFDRMNSLQSLVMGEFTGFYSFIFYTLSILISYFLTSTPRTSGARFWLFVLMTFNIVFERLLVWCGGIIIGTISQATDSTTNQNAHIYGQLWLCRKVFTLLGGGVWAWVAYNYHDLNRINNQLLVDIQKQNSDLKHLLQGGHSPPQLKPAILGSVDPETSGSKEQAEVVTVGQNILPVTSSYSLISNSSTGYESDSSESSSSSSATDHTFVVDNEDDHSDTESMSITSGRSGRSNTPSLLGELDFLRQSTPIRELAQAAPASVEVVRRVGRPRGSRSATPVTSPNMERLGVSHYSLRSRGIVHDNPCVHTETPSAFKQKVKHLARIAQRNNRLVRTMQNREQQLANGGRFFSSDDD